MAGIGKKRKKALSFGESMASELEISPDSYSDCPLIEICGDRETFVSGCRSLLEYSSEKITFDSTLGTVKICGHSLSISGFSDNRMLVSGRIASVTIGAEEDT